jgi:hypothetical protein
MDWVISLEIKKVIINIALIHSYKNRSKFSFLNLFDYINLNLLLNNLGILLKKDLKIWICIQLLLN